MTDAALKLKFQQGPNEKQAAASDPLKSVWVGASAGTGKTKVLIDRVLRLMLPRVGMDAKSATPPGKVLCLTFTKTAAAEMSNRIYQKLSEWAVKDSLALRDDLRQLNGAEPSPEMEEEARRLFARVLDTPGGLKIMTIHSFCQSVLKRFPIEAGLAPHFNLMDEQSAIEYLTKCLHDIIAQAKKNPDSDIAEAFALLALHLDSAGMSDLMSKIMSQRSHLAEILKAHGDAEGFAAHTIDGVYEYLGLQRGDSEENILAASAKIPPEHEAKLKKCLLALLDGSDTDKKKAVFLQAWLESPQRRPALFHFYAQAYFTQAGEIAKRMATKACEKSYPDIVTVMVEEAERLQVIREKLQGVRLAQLNHALLTVASEMVGHYARYKRFRDCLDFDDLILKTCELLSDRNTVQWVLFKLDEGIDHILVDEAQDTSPYQWRVIKALSEEFFAGSGARDGVARTLFVVGDEKQSIFSFQGADPAEFANMQEFFGAKAAYVQEGWEILLDYSFRSTRTVLDVVDRVFADPAAKKGVVSDISRDILHRPFRMKAAGMVELWPLMTSAVKEDAEPWQMPTDVSFGDNAASRLASRIASEIKGWIDRREMLPSKGRPIRPGDILILVQSRGALVEMLMRALKEADVPVAGIDRMTLSQEIAVMDLVAMAGFALQPKDDLLLATILKSPLIGMGEDALFTLCHGRKTSLWQALQQQQPEIAAYLKPLLDSAGSVTPYEFFAQILNTPCHADKVSGRRAFYGRLGFDIADALDEFLNASLHYEQSHTPSVQKFTDWFVRGEAQIKREQDGAAANLVRIMTVHASKGLQSPIVILPDTVKKLHDHNKGRIRLIWPEEASGVPLWSPRSEFDAPAYASLRDAAKEGQEEEYRRLLYVALTRAEDRLYIGGYQGHRAAKDDCWYKLVEKTFPADAEKEIFMDGEDGPLHLKRVTHAQEEAPPAQSANTNDKRDAVRAPLPPWAFHPPAPEPAPSHPLAPSRPGEDEPAAKGPLSTDTGWKFRRGIIVHQILETLPQLPPEKREKALAAWLSRPALDMTADEQKIFAREVLDVLTHPDFAPIFGAGSRAEVPVVGFAGMDKKVTQILSGQMDRILVTDTEVLIVDYKTNRPSPKHDSDVSAVYLKQMASYVSVMKKIYPDHTVKSALLWTDGPYLMPLSDKLLDPYMR